jgi:hypothetical protein
MAQHVCAAAPGTSSNKALLATVCYVVGCERGIRCKCPDALWHMVGGLQQQQFPSHVIKALGVI